MEEQALEVVAPSTMTTTVDAQGVLEAMQQVQQVLRDCAVEGEDFMTLEGTAKPTMLQPLAEKLAYGARLVPDPKIEELDLGGDHKRWKVSGHLVDLEGVIRGSGSASCSTMESKYRYRYVTQPCPQCGKAGSIIKGKEEFGGGWLCWRKRDGCGAKFPDTENFTTRREENPDLADVWNTVEQMAIKRWLVSTVKRTLALSGMFTMDLEDSLKPAPKAPEKEPAKKPNPSTARGRGKPPQQGRPAKAPPPPAAGRKGGMDLGSNAPPVDAYEQEAAAPQRGAAERIVSPQLAGQLGGMAMKAGVEDVTPILKAIGFKGTKLINLPHRLVEAFTKALPAVEVKS